MEGFENTFSDTDSISFRNFLCAEVNYQTPGGNVEMWKSRSATCTLNLTTDVSSLKPLKDYLRVRIDKKYLCVGFAVMVLLQVITPASLFLLLTLSVVVESQRSLEMIYTHHSVCALKGSSVTLGCRYSRRSLFRKSFSRVFWSKAVFTLKEPPDLSADPQYIGRVQYLKNTPQDCTLRLSNVTDQDSSKYYATGVTSEGQVIQGSGGVNLSVTDLQVEMIPSMVEEQDLVTLTCKTSCIFSDSPTFTWYKNDRELDSISENLILWSVTQQDAGKYSCSVEGESVRSPHIALFVHYPPKSVSVSISPSGDIAEGSSVTLMCSSDANPPARVYTWYKERSLIGTGKTHNIRKISSEDSGFYKCKAGNLYGEKESDEAVVNVRYAPKSVSVSISPSGEIVEGATVTLSCSSDDKSPLPDYTWYKGTSILGRESTYIIRKIKPEDSGQYKCKFSNGYGERYSDDVTLSVLYAPKKSSVSISPSGDIVEGSSVTLTCSSDANPPAFEYTWYKESSLIGTGKTHSIKKISSKDRGGYKCKARNPYGEKESDKAAVNVRYPPKSVSVSISPTGDIAEGSSVTLKCSSNANPPVLEYTWYKESSLIGTEKTHNIRKISSEDSGFYKCKAGNPYGEKESNEAVVNVRYAPKSVSVSISPSGEIIEGATVTLSCSSDDKSPLPDYTWYKGTSILGRESIYIIRKIKPEDRGQYKCKFSNGYGERYSDNVTLSVLYAPKKSSVSISPSGDIVEGSSVTLTCSSDANPPAFEYTWYKESSLIGTGKTHSIKKISSKDRGGYKCKARNPYGEKESDKAAVNVRYPPKSVSVSISPTGDIAEGSSVTLKCSSDANPPALEYTWYKERSLIGTEKTHNIRKICSEDSGFYKCKAGNPYGEKESNEAVVNVRYAPKSVSVSISPTVLPKQPSISISPSGEIVEGATVTLSCSSDDKSPLPDCTWYKGTSIVGRGSTYIIRKIKPEDRGQYKCKFSNGYEERYSDNVTVSILYAPKKSSVSISPSGDIVEGSSVTLRCSSDANPPVTYTWFKENVFISTARTYTFTKISPEDSGEYKCKSGNRFGVKYSNVDLNVLYPPRNVSMSISSAGETVTLTCSAAANPPVHNYTWFKDNERLAVGVGQNYSITMNFSSDGWFSCEARNKYGNQRAPPVSLMLNGETENSMVSWIIIGVGVGVGVVVGVAAFIAGLFCVRSKRQKKNTTKHQDVDTHIEDNTYTSLKPMTMCSKDVCFTLADVDTHIEDNTYTSFEPMTMCSKDVCFTPCK
ncbi:B-cell receptor CD22-like [Silurus meridionalis]|uniref:B-cell receptor CD22-like n=1 Tax=Silurus meridionalis TaxID=175797 RepID=UPI001EEAB84F|nr:B-cell receptor CD22-like [Silurus meridionalis]